METLKINDHLHVFVAGSQDKWRTGGKEMCLNMNGSHLNFHLTKDLTPRKFFQTKRPTLREDRTPFFLSLQAENKLTPNNGFLSLRTQRRRRRLNTQGMRVKMQIGTVRV